MPSDKTVRIQYYALLREERGIAAETVKTTAVTLAELYDELRQKHDLSLSRDRMSVAVNEAFASWDDQLKDSDSIVFVPPVAGG